MLMFFSTFHHFFFPLLTNNLCILYLTFLTPSTSNSCLCVFNNRLPRLARYLQAAFIVTNSFGRLNKLETWINLKLFQFNFFGVLFLYSFSLFFFIFNSGSLTNHKTRFFVVEHVFNSRYLHKTRFFVVEHVFDARYLQYNSITQLTGNVFLGLGNLQTL